MGVIIEYFVAQSEAAAAAAIELADIADAVEAPDIDPVVALGGLDELLTGRSFDDTLEDPETARTVASRDGDQRVVVTVNPSTVAALAAATQQQLEQVVQPWSEMEEFYGAGDPVVLAGLLHELAGMARAAQQSGRGMYCRLVT